MIRSGKIKECIRDGAIYAHNFYAKETYAGYGEMVLAKATAMIFCVFSEMGEAERNHKAFSPENMDFDSYKSALDIGENEAVAVGEVMKILATVICLPNNQRGGNQREDV